MRRLFGAILVVLLVAAGVSAAVVQSPAPDETSSSFPGSEQAHTPRSGVGTGTGDASASFDLSISQTRPPETRALLRVTVRLFLDARLTNEEDVAADNVRVEARARVGDDYILIDGRDRLTVPLGAIATGETVTKSLSTELTMSLGQGRRAQREGIIFEFSVVSSEGTQLLDPLLCREGECNPL